MTHIKTVGTFLILGIPFLIGLIPQSADNPLILAPFLMMATALILGNRFTKTPANDLLLLLILGLWLVWGVSGLLSPVPFHSKVTWIIFAALPFSYILTRTTKADLHTPLLAISAPLATYTLWQLANGTNRPDFPFDDTNLLGILMALATITALKHKATLYIVPLFLAALIATESRTALLALAAALPVYFAFAPVNLKQTKKKNLLLMMMSIAMLAVLMVVFTGFDTRIGNTLDQSSGRLAIWQSSWKMAWEHPLTGMGLGTFHLHYPPYRLPADNSMGFMVHMEPLQFAVESGWAAPLLLYAIFATALILAFKNKRENAAPIAILTILFVSMHLTYPLHVVSFMILIGYALATIRNNKQETPKTGLPFSLSLLITTLLCTYMAITTIYTFLLWSDLKESLRSRDTQQFQATLNACLIQGDPEFPDCRIMAARFTLLNPQIKIDNINKLLNEAKNANPLNAEIPFLQAQNMLLNHPDKMAAVESLAQESLALNPGYWPARKLAIVSAISRKDRATARKLMDQGMAYRYPLHTRKEIIAMQKTLEP